MIPLGAHARNTGGKKGRSGRKPDELRQALRDGLDRLLPMLAKYEQTDDPAMHLKLADFYARYGVGPAAQELKIDTTQSEPLRIIHERVQVPPRNRLQGLEVVPARVLPPSPSTANDR